MPQRLTHERVNELKKEARYVLTRRIFRGKPSAGERLAAEAIVELCEHADYLADLLKRWIDLMSVYPAVEGEFTYALDVEGAQLLKETREVLPEKSKI